MPTPVARPTAKRSDHPTSPQEGAQPTPQPTAAEVRDAAAEQLDAARQVSARRSPRRGPSWQSAASGAARAYDQDGRAGLDGYLRSHPRALAALATAPREKLEEAVKDAAGWYDGGAVMGELSDRIEARARQGVRQHAFRTIDRHIGQLERMGRHIGAHLDDFRNPRPGSREAAIASRLGIGPGSGPADVDAAIGEAVAGLRELRARFAGNAWEVGDFPVSANRVASREGWRITHGEETLVDGALGERSGSEASMAAEATHAADAAITSSELAAEYSHAQAAAAAGHGAELAAGVGLSVGIFVAGLVVGHAIHHEAEHQRGEAIAHGRALGL